jgi:branched-chain amino acid transport system substrate-binding protein
VRLRRIAALAALLAAGTGLSACERADEKASDTGSTTLTVYASLPLQGPAGPDATATSNGVRLALRDAGGKVGGFTVKLSVLDDSTPKTGRWDPKQTAENARSATRDRSAIAYVGDGPSGATAISLPILNAAGIAQVSPSSGYQGLTRAVSADKGEPEKYYPTGKRSFVRPVPNDLVQSRALMAALQDEGCRRLQLLEDRDVDGRGLATALDLAATTAGLEVVSRDVLRPGDDPRDEAADVLERRADCAVYTGSMAAWVPPFFDALHAANPALPLFGGDGVATAAFASALRPGTQARTRLTAPPGVLEPRAAVRAVVTRYREAFGTAPRSGALYGYESMQLVLDAIRRAGAEGNDRAAVMEALLSGGERRGPLGTSRIGPDGDTSSTAYAELAVRGGRLVHVRTRPFPG